MLMALTLGLLAAGCAFIAVRGLATNRPFLFSPTWLLGGVVVASWVNLGLAVRRVAEVPAVSGEVTLQPLILPALVAAAALLLFVQFRGYIAIGVTGPLFNEALFVAIRKLGLPFEQRFSVVRVPSARTTIRVSVQNLVGMAQIKRQRPPGGRVVRDIARSMNGYFQSRRIAIYQIACLYYLALALMLAVVAWQLWQA